MQSNIYGADGDDEPRFIVATPDSGFIVAGQSGYNSTGLDILIVRIDAQGDTLWTSIIGTPTPDYISGFTLLDDGTMFIAGQLDASGPFGTYRMFIARLDSFGQIIWSRRYSPTNTSGSATAIIPLADSSGFFVTGGVSPGMGWQAQTLAMKIDSAGNVLWANHIGLASNNESAGFAHETSDGGFMLIGTRNNYAVMSIKIDSAGNFLWAKTYDGPGQDYMQDALVLPSGDFVITGSTFSYANNPFLIRITETGDTVWCRSYGGGNQTEHGRSLVLTPENNINVVGSTMNFGPQPINYNVWMFETDTNGTYLWSRMYGNAGWDEGVAHCARPGGAFVVASRDGSSALPGMYNYWLFETDSIGAANICGEYATPGYDTAAPFAVTSFAFTSNPFNAIDSADVLLWRRGTTVLPYCMTTTFEENPSVQPEVDVYPVPCGSEITFEMSGALLGSVRVTDLTGRVVAVVNADGASEIILDMSNYANGIYMISGVLTNGPFVRKVIVEH